MKKQHNWEVPWTLEFDELVTAMVLECGSELEGVNSYSELGMVRAALRKYYREDCVWGFDEIAGVMIEQILNRIRSS